MDHSTGKTSYSGWIKLYRSCLDWLTDPILWVFWCYCLLKATHKEKTILIGKQQIKLLPGQFVTGRKKAARDLGISERQIRTCIDALKARHSITHKPTNKFSIITIVNWHTYQSWESDSDQQDDQQSASKTPQTRKEEGKKKKKKDSPYTPSPHKRPEGGNDEPYPTDEVW